EPAVEQPHRARQNASAVDLGAFEVVRDALAQLRQRAGEAGHVVELLGVAALAPALVVQVLLASGGVDARRLQVAERVRADPDVLPRRRDAELADPRQVLPGPEQSDRRNRLTHGVFPRVRRLSLRPSCPPWTSRPRVTEPSPSSSRPGNWICPAPRCSRRSSSGWPPSRSWGPWYWTCAASSSWTRAGCGSWCWPTCGRARPAAASRSCAAPR